MLKIWYTITYTDYGKRNIWLHKDTGKSFSTTRKMRENKIV